MGALRYIGKIIIQRVLGLLLYFIGSWQLLSLRASLYFIVYFLTAIISCFIMYRINSVTLSERNKIGTNTPKWDKILLGVYWLFSFFIVYLVAGLEAVKQPNTVGILYWVGIAMQLSASAIAFWALANNTFLESTARVQHDREQTVCKTGPYKFIRHPTYSAILLWCVSIIFIFETLFTGIIAVMITIIIIVRTYLEDTMLKNELNGYLDYSHEVKHRLIPFIW